MQRLLDQQQIQAAVERLADDVSAYYVGRPLTVIGVLTGSVVLLADLIRRLDFPVQVGVIQARSYRGHSTEPGPLQIDPSMLPNVEGRDVLLVDDIFDTGQTLAALVEQMATLGPRRVRTAVLLLKRGRQKVALRPDYVGFEIPDAFVVGYGLDFHDAYRHLPYVAVLEADDMAAGPS